ncbi:trypsin-like isoform X1 [Apis cerana]|uniref:trypsin-like isoform X1 n=1 Tax=Apis cerana TaxID=7461 RepID=UPI0007E2CD68|nr:trypsin-like isoform X1 [Apis cerana]
MSLTSFVLGFLFITTYLTIDIDTQSIKPETNSNPNSEIKWTIYDLTGRIVNGSKASLRQFPYQVSLRETHSYVHFCGGSLIHEKYILTAAHCMFDESIQIQPWMITVVAGELQLWQPTSTGQRRGVEKINVHPNFNSVTLENDITILTLKISFKLTPEVNIAPLTDHTPIPTTICQVAGWGYPNENYPVTSEDLMFVDLPLMSRDLCKELLKNITDFPPGMICAGYMEGQKDACQGDSGGGMICNGELTGIVSGGNGCARPRTPGVYTDIYFYINWIAEITEEDTFLKKKMAIKDESGMEQVMASMILPSIAFFILYHV